MTQHLNYGRRQARRGRGLIPPNPKQWELEHNGLDLRDDLGIALDEELPHDSAFDLLPGATVLPHGAVPAAAVHIEALRADGGKAWSGMALVLPGGHELVIYNDAHPLTRVRATLMEEFFHIRLGHPRSRLRLHSEDGAFRSYNPEIEHQAYGSGAAALVPYQPLHAMVARGDSPEQIAHHFGVSRELVVYRCKVTRDYKRLRKARTR